MRESGWQVMHTKRQLPQQHSLAVDNVVYLGAEGIASKAIRSISSGAVREQELYLGNILLGGLVSSARESC